MPKIRKKKMKPYILEAHAVTGRRGKYENWEDTGLSYEQGSRSSMGLKQVRSYRRKAQEARRDEKSIARSMMKQSLKREIENL